MTSRLSLNTTVDEKRFKDGDLGAEIIFTIVGVWRDATHFAINGRFERLRPKRF